MAEFLTIGEPLYGMASLEEDVELSEVSEFRRYLAGAEVNVAIGMSRLGVDVSYTTQLGNDVFSKYIIKELNKNKIGTESVFITEDYNTAFQLKSKVSTGDPIFGYLRKNSAGTQYNQENLDDIDYSEMKIIHATGLFPALSQMNYNSVSYLMKIARLKGSLLTFDPNLRPQLWKSEKEMVKKLNRLAFNADIVMPGLKEGQILTGETSPEKIADFYLEKGVKTVIIKLGPEGAFFKNNEESHVIPGFKIAKVVDTVGAGDGFAVGVLSGLIRGYDLKDCVERGVAIGALAVTVMGDSDGYPDEETLQEFIKNGKRWENK